MKRGVPSTLPCHDVCDCVSRIYDYVAQARINYVDEAPVKKHHAHKHRKIHKASAKIHKASTKAKTSTKVR